MKTKNLERIILLTMVILACLLSAGMTGVVTKLDLWGKMPIRVWFIYVGVFGHVLLLHLIIRVLFKVTIQLEEFLRRCH